MQRLPLKMWLKNVASGCGSITQRIKNGLHFYFILACCFSFFFMFMIPTYAQNLDSVTDGDGNVYACVDSYISHLYPSYVACKTYNNDGTYSYLRSNGEAIPVAKLPFSSDGKLILPGSYTTKYQELYPYWMVVKENAMMVGGSEYISHSFYAFERPLVYSVNGGNPFLYDTSNGYNSVIGHGLSANYAGDFPGSDYNFAGGSDVRRFQFGSVDAADLFFDNNIIASNFDIVDIKTNDVLFPQPQTPNNPTVELGETWTALYNLIAQNALVIVGIVGVLLIPLWISLRLLVKLFRIFTTSSSRSQGK